MKQIGIGLLGFGTIGAGVVEGLRKNADVISARLGVRPVLRKIADIDLKSDRGVKVDSRILTKNAMAVIDDPAVDIVIELIGGTGIAKKLVMHALEKGKPVVTANKALLATCGSEIFRLAEKKNADIYFGASVGGGIPIIRALREGLLANRIESIYGILNGTCNYILTKMEKECISFGEALREAQAKGYAEANPSLDIEGVDTAHKSVILASLAYGRIVPMEAVHIDGIRNVTETDIRCAHDLGYRIKLLAVVKTLGGRVEVRVNPALVPLDHVLASVGGVYNAVLVRGDMAGETLYYGRGAGRKPTASTVISDVADVIRNLVAESPRRVPAVAHAGAKVKVMDPGQSESKHYIRLSLQDKAGVLAQYATVLGRYGISIASVMQKEGGKGRHVPVVIVTHRAVARQVDKALREISRLGVVNAKPVWFRIEDWK